MKSLNEVTLIGNVTGDPELKATQQGKPICTFGLATNERFKDANGEQKEIPEFHNVVVWDKFATLVGEKLKKGSGIFLRGRIKTRSWEKDGVKHYKTEIVAKEIIFLDKKDGGVPEDNAPVESTEDVPF
jgi:single-strand DNA-binding protein